MISLIRICNVPTEKFNTVGYHAYKLNQLSDIYSHFISAKIEGKPLPFNKDSSSLKRFDFLLEPFPREGSFLDKVYFSIKRIWSIIIFSFKIIFRSRLRKSKIIHIHSPMYYLVALAGKILGKKVYISFHGEDFNRIKNNKIYAFFAKIFDGVFAISPHMVPTLKKIHNCPVYFIGNGVDFENFYNIGKLRKKQIVFVASFKNVKRHDLMLDGFKQFVENPKFKEYELVLVGEGEKMKFYQDYVKQNQVSNVVFVGQKTSGQLLQIYNESEVMCLTSDSEGFPKVVLEALACGCIIVSTKVGSVPDIFGENYPFYIENSDIDSVANALCTAVEHKDKMNKYYGLVKDYSWHQVAEQYEKIYKNDLCIN